MTKREIQNIVNKDWDKRRLESLKKRKLNSEQTKEWKLKEKVGTHPTSTHKKPIVTLSLLVAVTYAREP